MSYTTTTTVTYTVSDVKKVFEAFAADYDMICQATGLITKDYAAKVMADVISLAQSGYLDVANIVLFNAAGTVVRAAKYEVSRDASSWDSARPGNNLWPRTPSGRLQVVLEHSKEWDGLSDLRKENVNKSLKLSWVDSSTDTRFPHLRGAFDRRYASNAFGLTKTNYEEHAG